MRLYKSQIVFIIALRGIMATTKELLAIRIKQIRKKKGLTQEQLAEKIGRDTKHISKLEIAGSYPSIETLDRIASALDIEIKEFFNFDGLRDKSFIKNEFIKLINNTQEHDLQILYKIHKTLMD